MHKFLTHSLSGSLASIVVVEFWTNCLICAKSTQTDFSIAHTRAQASWKKQENYYDWVIFAACSSKVIFAPSSEFRKQSWIIGGKRIDFGKWNVNYIGFQSFIALDLCALTMTDSNFHWNDSDLILKSLWLILSALHHKLTPWTEPFCCYLSISSWNLMKPPTV